MRIIALVLVLLSVHAIRAEAEPQELSNLRAAVRDATDRLKKSNLSSARVFVKKGRDAIGKASAELDKRCSQLEGELGKRKATGCGRRYAGISHFLGLLRRLKNAAYGSGRISRRRAETADDGRRSKALRTNPTAAQTKGTNESIPNVHTTVHNQRWSPCACPTPPPSRQKLALIIQVTWLALPQTTQVQTMFISGSPNPQGCPFLPVPMY